jgi:hypothetical protein
MRCAVACRRAAVMRQDGRRCFRLGRPLAPGRIGGRRPADRSRLVAARCGARPTLVAGRPILPRAASGPRARRFRAATRRNGAGSWPVALPRGRARPTPRNPPAARAGRSRRCCARPPRVPDASARARSWSPLVSSPSLKAAGPTPCASHARLSGSCRAVARSMSRPGSRGVTRCCPDALGGAQAGRGCPGVGRHLRLRRAFGAPGQQAERGLSRLQRDRQSARSRVGGPGR